MAEGSSEFDRVAAEYEAELNKGLAASGESKDYFARGRVEWVGRCLETMGVEGPKRVLDFGCGTGSAVPFFLKRWPGVERVVGTDVSAGSLAVARREFGGERAEFHLMEQWQEEGAVDLAFCNGVFHHIRPEERAGAMAYVYRALRPGGIFALWENNPWNLGTRYVMSRIPFDREAIMLWPGETRRRMREAGFEVLRRDFLFVFPRALRGLRWMERFLVKVPAGGQYVVMGRKGG